MYQEKDILKDEITEGKPFYIKWILPLAILVLVIFADQYLKYWVKHNMVMHTEKTIAGKWFLFHFTENNGMAFGIEFWGKYGKLFLTLFRVGVAFFGFWYLYNSIKKHMKIGFLICVSLILAGAIGNIIDCVFYGVWYKPLNDYQGGYLLGRVVDMLYFPIVETHYPSWFPHIKLGSFEISAGDPFTFFSPVFNIADTAISAGVIAIIVFQKRYFVKGSLSILEDDTTSNELKGEDTSSDNLAASKNE